MARRFNAVFWWFLAALLSQLAVTAHTAVARPSIRVALDARRPEVADAALVHALTRSMEVSVRGQRGLELVPRERADFVLWGAVTKLAERADGELREVDCNVSVIVTDATGGSIRFTLAGRAVARGDGASSNLAQEAMVAAVRGAMKPLERGLGAVTAR